MRLIKWICDEWEEYLCEVSPASRWRWKIGGTDQWEWAQELPTEVIVGLAGCFHRYPGRQYRMRPVLDKRDSKESNQGGTAE